jgi:8-oxo-dGTP pyrophosphatase MutT (NUDIX family)
MELKPWKTLESRYISESPWISLRADRCETAEGHLVDPYYVIEAPDWAHIVAFTKDCQVITTRQYRHPAGKVMWEIPCGEIDASDASPETAAQRELLEETGYTSARWELLGVLYPNPARQTNKFYTFIATECEKVAEPSPDAEEIISCELVSVETLIEAFKNGDFNHAIHIASLFQALSKQELSGLARTP